MHVLIVQVFCMQGKHQSEINLDTFIVFILEKFIGHLMRAMLATSVNAPSYLMSDDLKG